jgi:hypothetical protein
MIKIIFLDEIVKCFFTKEFIILIRSNKIEISKMLTKCEVKASNDM